MERMKALSIWQATFWKRNYIGDGKFVKQEGWEKYVKRGLDP